MPTQSRATARTPFSLVDAFRGIGDLFALAKPRLSGMVVSTTAAGLGTALALGIALPAFAIPMLAFAANPLTALLALVALVSYAFVYTPMKRWSTAALFVGAVPGAIPPLMGWTAATGSIDARGLALFALLFVWQLPHFLAISIYLKEDYARGGLKVFALVHGERAAKIWAVGTSAILVPVGMLPAFLGMASWGYGAVAALLGLGLAAGAATGLRIRIPEGSSRWARNFFLSTLLYLVLVFIALFLGAR
ncbi:MAG: protoheme IX farnesyltransferase [Deltaproteobacteria bacterium]|nr:protoheme IX farnesyltransferase [Deltaproteobacteria bacterium]